MYKCPQCGYQSATKYVLCPKCQNGVMQQIEDKPSFNNRKKGSKRKRGFVKPKPLTNVTEMDAQPYSTGVQGMDNVLDGGIVPGGVYLLSGEPGGGKSTLATMIALALSEKKQVLYVSGEEVAGQFKRRALRLSQSPEIKDKVNWANVFVDDSRIIDNAIQAIQEHDYAIVVIDSINSVRYDGDNKTSLPGSVAQIRAVISVIRDVAKDTRTPVLVIGQVTKEGDVAGPRSLEHDVDAHLEMQVGSAYRFVRPTKNRFASIETVGVFKMEEHGMRSVLSPVTLFLDEDAFSQYGLALGVHWSDIALIITVEAQATKMVYASPTRNADGYPRGKLNVLLSAMNELRHPVGVMDVSVKIMGGMSVKDPGYDLAIVAAIYSSAAKKVWGSTLFLGEVGLTGLVRPVSALSARMRSAAVADIRNIVVPAKQVQEAQNIMKTLDKPMNIIPIKKVVELDKIHIPHTRNSTG